ncbi:MAG: hypothetical protein ABSG64_10745 [Solirubrobacteraceae bacterium]|jgi:hypothetical protein
MISTEPLEELEQYRDTLARLVSTVQTEGKSSSAIFLMKDLSARDIGMIGWRIPSDWQDQENARHLQSVLDQIGGDAEALRKAASNESGPPTLSMVATAISMTVERLLSRPPL